jgi:hypothetical protein
MKNLNIISAMTIVWLANACTAMAQGRPPIVPPGTEGLFIPNSGSSNVAPEEYFGGSFLPAITRNVIAGSGAVAILFLIIGGVEILTAYGNEEKITKGKKTITFAIVGLLIALLSYAIVTIISSINLNSK